MSPASSGQRPEVQAIANMISARTGLSFPESRWPIAEAAIRRRQKQTGAGSLASYLALLQSRESAFEDLVNELTVGETYFFRDPAQFDFIAREVLPRAASQEGPIRAWSAGCATGEEPFSLAILLDQLGLAERGSVIGTDIAGPRLARARSAVYGSWSLRGCSEGLVSTYFEKGQHGYRLVPRIQQAVVFSELNLAEPNFLTRRSDLRRLDLVFCRNVLIYLDRETTIRVASALLESLNPGGWLLLGASDPPLQDLVPCRAELTDAGLAYQRQPARQPPASSPPPTTPVPFELTGGTALSAEAPHLPSAERIARGRRERAVPRRPLPKAAVSPAAPPARAAGSNQFSNKAACVSELRTLLNQRRLAGAEAAFSAAVERHPASAEIAYLHAVLLSELGRHTEAARAARDALYLDRGFAVAHLALSRALEHIGHRSGAERALRNAASTLSKLPADASVPGADGEAASVLLEMVRARMRLLKSGT